MSNDPQTGAVIPLPSRPKSVKRRVRSVPLLLLWQLLKFFRRGHLLPKTAARLLRQELKVAGYETGRDPTRAESVVREDGVQRGQEIINDAEQVASGQAGDCDRMSAEAAELRQRADRAMTRQVLTPRGRAMSLKDAKAAADEAAERIEEDEANGSLRHRRVPRWIRRIIWVFTGIVDYPIMLWFGSSIFDVNWSHPLSIELGVSVGFSVLTTGAGAIVEHVAGHMARDYKTDERGVDWDELPSGHKAALVVVLTIIPLASVTVFARVYTEAVASGETLLAVLFASLVAVVLLAANFLVVWTGFADGSEERDMADACHRQVHEFLAQQDRDTERADQLEHRVQLLRRQAERDRAIAFGRASEPMRKADQLIDLHNALYQPNGTESLPQVDPNNVEDAVGYHAIDDRPVIDERTMKKIFQHIEGPLDFDDKAVS